MDPAGSPCLRSPPGPAPLWGCLWNPHTEASAASGPPRCQPAPFSFHQKPDFPAAATAAHPDFSASCLAATPHSLPREQHPAFPQPPDWHLPVPEARQRLGPGPAGGPGETVASSPGPAEDEGSPGRDCGALGSAAAWGERRPSGRRKQAAGRWLGGVFLCGPGGCSLAEPGPGHERHRLRTGMWRPDLLCWGVRGVPGDRLCLCPGERPGPREGCASEKRKQG